MISESLCWCRTSIHTAIALSETQLPRGKVFKLAFRRACQIYFYFIFFFFSVYHFSKSPLAVTPRLPGGYFWKRKNFLYLAENLGADLLPLVPRALLLLQITLDGSVCAGHGAVCQLWHRWPSVPMAAAVPASTNLCSQHQSKKLPKQRV